MGTVIRAKLSEKNRYYVDKHRYYELKHFCLQYPLWKQLYLEADGMNGREMNLSGAKSNSIGDPTSRCVDIRLAYLERIELVERIAKETDAFLADYILKGVTEGLSYTYLKTKLKIPCGREMYYNRYRRFFWLLDQVRK